MSNSPREFIKERLGGPTAAARVLKVKPKTVEMWAFRKRIPRTAWPEILDAYPELTMDELKALEAA